jgi:flagellar biosynthesis/type III secretory pathway ATPase
MSADGPLSWRDVYTAVGESESRTRDDIADLQKAVLGVTTDHEGRLRVIEAAALMNMGKRQGVIATLGVGKTALLFAFSAMGPVLAVIALVLK